MYSIRNGLRTATVAILMPLMLVVGGVANADSTTKPQPAGVTPLIVGGDDARTIKGEVSLQLGVHRCGGSLITRQWVLTAAHCSTSHSTDTLVRVGSLRHDTGGKLVGVKQVVIFPGSDPETFGGDFALVGLNQRVAARPIPMFFGPGRVGTPNEITGWGRICEDPADPACSVPTLHLQRLDTKVVDPSRCYLGETPDGRPVFNPKTEVCIASADGQPRMACNGDSGGPLHRKIYGEWFLVGITSGDGDDYGPRPYACTTRPSDGKAGAGIWGKTNTPEVRKWIPGVLFGRDPAAAREFNVLNPQH